MGVLRTIANWLGLAATVFTLACTPAPHAPAPGPVSVSDFDHLVGYVFVSEGYTYENVRGDPGGPTKYGVTIHDVRAYLNPAATADDVARLTLADAKVIYRDHYWEPIGDDHLATGVNYSVFDYAVNAGVSRALVALRQCSPAMAELVVRCIYEKRMAYQMGLPQQYNKFKRGWRNRITSVEHISLAMLGVEKAFFATDLYLIPRIGRGKAY